MHIYSFDYKQNKLKIFELLKRHTYNGVNAFLQNEIECTIKNTYIKLRKKKHLQHPLQRIFIGKIYENDSKTTIIGTFRYPFINLVCFIIILFILIVGNINMLFGNASIATKAVGCALFLCFYILIAFLFISGKKFFSKEEKEIIDFLKTLE